MINLFSIISEDFFKPLNSKYKSVFIDCIMLIFNSYRTELSFGVDKEVLVAKLEDYFDNQYREELFFDDDNEIIKDSRAKANSIIGKLKECGWIDTEMANDYKVKVNLKDYAVTFIEAFDKIVKNEEMEYQSYITQIYAMLLNKDLYNKPYVQIIKRVIANTEELIVGLKKLNTNIKKYIDQITNEKTASEIVEDFFVYHKEIGSKAYHRIKTSDNISHFRNSIIDNLYNILSDEIVFNNAAIEYMEVEKVEDKAEAENLLKEKILNVIAAFRNYDDIVAEIDYKNSRYISSAVARAKFLLTNTNNAEGKISKILSYLSNEFNNDDNIDLYDEIDNQVLEIFSIFPQNYIDSDSLYVVPMTRKSSIPSNLDNSILITEEERMLRKLLMQEKNQKRFSRKNINKYVDELLSDNDTKLASTLELNDKRDFIRLIFISLYGNDKKSCYKVSKTGNIICVNNFKFGDFIIERCK